jgi:hypothetical protein
VTIFHDDAVPAPPSKQDQSRWTDVEA